jgi:hypothetical protein
MTNFDCEFSLDSTHKSMGQGILALQRRSDREGGSRPTNGTIPLQNQGIEAKWQTYTPTLKKAKVTIIV